MTQTTAHPLPMERKDPLAPPVEYDRLRTEAPVSRLSFPDGSEGWLVSRFADVTSALVNPVFSSERRFNSSAVNTVTLTEEERKNSGFAASFIGMDPPDHTRYRRMLTGGQFTVRRMKSLTPRIEQIVDEHLDAMEAAGPPADLVQQFALPIPSLVICELLGVPYEDRVSFQGRTSTLLRLDRSKEELLDALNGMATYMRGLVADKRRNPDDALISDLITAVPEDGVPLTDEELLGISNLLLVAGHETTANMIGLGTLALLTHPDQWAMVRDNPDTIERAVEEMLRYLSIIQFGLPRIAKADTMLGDQQVKAGESVVLALASANRDAAHFASPEILDVTRDAIRHVGFGYGVHQCLGQQLARMEMRSAFAKLTQRFPNLRLAVPADEVPMRSDMAIYGVHKLPVSW
ncbi:cytochrome P450 [Fodinicola feengrottensis]|uniref:cytochrome P450 n=1 Tax=Fodinicola feengrottensis TaxID=435914 RepID=UPI0013D88DF1|nr:cytochrome P450 [Fodinicola feengrottensis]